MKISAVLVSRNDNYGGNLKERAVCCINSMIDCMDEIWYIDWNTDNDKQSLLYEIYDDISHTGKINHIVVDSETAKALTWNNPNAQKCCEVLGRNLGIRRATGDWIISTNIDVIAPKRNDLINTIKDLDENTFYTLSRRSADVDFAKWDYKDWKRIRDDLYKSVGERHFNEKVTNGDDYSIISCCGDFQMAHKELWKDIKGFEERLIYCLYSDTNVQKKAVMHEYELKAIFNPPIFHINHGKGGAGFLDGINRVANNLTDAITTQNKTQNLSTWGFSNNEVEYETI